MNIRNFTERYFRVAPVIFIAAWLTLMITSCTKQNAEQKITQAYELRMNGHADSAKVILQDVTLKNSGDAAAWYELARTEHYIGLGNPRQLLNHLENMEEDIGKAVEIDPENVIYTFYKGYVSYFRMYVSLMMNDPDIKKRVGEVVSTYETVLQQKPDYAEAALFLVEILRLPEEMGGDSVKAEKYTVQLEAQDPVLGAKARELRLPQDADRVEFWQKIVEDNPGSSEALEQLGKAYLYQDQPEEGMRYIEEAMKIDPGKTQLLLDLARYDFMVGMQDTLKRETVFPQAEKYVEKYLETDPIPPLEAYAYEMEAKIKLGQGDSENAGLLREKAAAIDPNYSKAFGIPPAILFAKPDEIPHFHRYFFRPL